MKNGRRQRVLHLTALLSVAAGLALTYRSVRAAPADLRHLRRRASDLNELYGMARDLRQDQAAIAHYEQLPAQRAVPLSELLKRALPNLHAEVRERERQQAAGGWTRRCVDVAVGEVRLEDLNRVLQEAEGQRPPWRLSECNIVAAGPDAGTGRATLVLETLEKAE